MNTIIIDNNEIVKADILYKKDKDNELLLDINNNQDLLLNIKYNNRININFNIKDNINFNLYIITEGENNNIKYNYNLNYNSSCNIEKLNIVNSINEKVIANLESLSTFNYIFKGITEGNEKYDYMIYHNGINSNSNIINNCVNESGSIYLQISSFIPKNITGCSANQFNRIINNTNNICEIKPNLYIDCCDVVANHSALIDKFSYNELFYLESRGINKKEAIKILTVGFLLSNIKNEEIVNLINKRYGGE